MQNYLQYDDSNDSEIFLEQEVYDLNLRLSTCTVANSDGKPNEDAFASARVNDQIWLAVFDGTTSLKSIPALGDTSGARFASHFLKDKFTASFTDAQKSPRDLLLYLNELLLQQTGELGGSLSDTHSLPASMATVVKIDLATNILSFAHVGDTYGIIFHNDCSSLVFTDDKNNKFDQGMFDLIRKIAIENSITNRQARQNDEVKKALYEMFIKRNNNPDGTGSGLVNGDPYMVKYLHTGEFSISDIKAVLLATDGLEVQGQGILDDKFRSYLLSEFKDTGFLGVIKLKKESEDADPDWNNIRYKHSDDATGIMIEFNQ